MDPKELTFEKLKMIYEVNAGHHRYYLSWRHYLLAGSFAVFASLFFSSYTLFEKGGNNNIIFSGILLLINGLVSMVFLFLDNRNRVLYRVCQHVGAKIEEVLLTKKSFEDTYPFTLDPRSKDNVGVLFTLQNSIKHEKEPPEKWGSHSYILNLYYRGVAIASILIGILIIYSQLLITLLHNHHFRHLIF
jgi:hypothetical protein